MKRNGAALDKGLQQYSDDKICKFMKNGNIIAVEERKDKLFIMKFKVIADEHQTNTAVCNSLFFWHKQMTHQNVDHVKKILKSENIIFKDQEFCYENCILGKIHRLSFPKSNTKSERRTHPCRSLKSNARKFTWRSDNGFEFANREIEELIDMVLRIRKRYHLYNRIEWFRRTRKQNRS
ncbi:uncharacterized protein LOC116415267 [Apis florea]|uniref:uncharacterized protein LOC116415267 n=1 Tax=Apis florea TaxID=7463 RepID=UPI0012FEE0EC|nr:uncharacterized protein LOC116415267 [Apis florea]